MEALEGSPAEGTCERGRRYSVVGERRLSGMPGSRAWRGRWAVGAVYPPEGKLKAPE
jgi:hypothetical protein